MRLVFLGPADGDHVALRAQAQLALDRFAPDRVVYLGADGIFDDALRNWAREIVNGDPSDAAVWERAVRVCAKSDHRTIDAFLNHERQRERLRRVTCLPHPKARSVELLFGLVTVVIHDKVLLDGEDMQSAELVVFGKWSEPMVHRVGLRVFVAPGPLAHSRGGMLLLTEEEGDVVASILDAKGEQARREVVASRPKDDHRLGQGPGA